MQLWQIYSIVGVVGIILEMVIPSMFFLNIAIAGFITAIISLFIHDSNILAIDFIVLAIVSVFLLRPMLLRLLKSSKDKETGINSEYIGKVVKVIEPISKYKGAITIYDERWDARIVKNDSLVMYVERI